MKKFAFAKKMPISVESRLFRSLAMLLDAHLSLSNALEVLEKQSHKKIQITALADWKQSVLKGESLSSALKESLLKISRSSIEIIKLGETSGNLSEMLKQASKQAENNLALKRKIFGALAYPLCIMTGTIILTIGLISFVFPKITPLFVSLNVTLPFSTRLLISTSQIIGHYWFYLIFGILIVAGGFFYGIKFSHKFKKYLWLGLTIVPIIGQVVRLGVANSFFNSIYNLMLGSLPLSKSLYLTAEYLRHPTYKQLCLEAGQAVEQGLELSAFLRNKKKEFQPVVAETLSVAERTGELTEAFGNLAKIFEQEFDLFIGRLTVFFEPLLMVFISLVIGFVAMSIMLPIYSITSHLQHV